jgi:hypothetical protein
MAPSIGQAALAAAQGGPPRHRPGALEPVVAADIVVEGCTWSPIATSNGIRRYLAGSWRARPVRPCLWTGGRRLTPFWRQSFETLPLYEETLQHAHPGLRFMSCDGVGSLSVRSSPGLSSLVLGSHDEPPRRDPSRHDLAGVTSKRCPVFRCSSELPSDLMLPPHRRPSGASPSFESDCRPRDGPQQRNSRPFRRMLAFLVRSTSVCALDHSTGRSTTLTCFSVFSSINPRLKIMHLSRCCRRSVSA